MQMSTITLDQVNSENWVRSFSEDLAQHVVTLSGFERINFASRLSFRMINY